MLAVVDSQTKWKIKTNETCSLQVHIGVKEHELMNLVCGWCAFENVFVLFVPPFRIKNYHCPFLTETEGFKIDKLLEFRKEYPHATKEQIATDFFTAHDKHLAFNFYTPYQTVEFRLHHSTLYESH
jgi:hypothetical protein